MGLMDKFKNLFTDEEIIEEEEIEEEPVKIKEVKVEEPKKEVNKLPTFMREKIEQERKETEFNVNNNVNAAVVPDFSINEIKAPKNDMPPINNFSNIEHEENSFKFPIDIEDTDFSDISRVSRQASRSTKKQELRQNVTPKKVVKKENVTPEKKVSELYKDKKLKKEEKKPKFKVTPIISPVYGVLDKNYKQEELKPDSGDNYEVSRPSKNVDFDSVRKKAYGAISKDIRVNLMCENCEYLKKAKLCKKNSLEENLTYETLCDVDCPKEENREIEDKNRDITLDEATENYYDYGVEYNKKIDELASEEVSLPKKEGNGVPPVKSSINLLSTLKKSEGEGKVATGGAGSASNPNKNLELTDDLFNLIDSMYDERKEQ